MVKTAIDSFTPISTTQIVQTKRHELDRDSAIGHHLLDNDPWALNYDNKRFLILAAARSSFHLNLLEAVIWGNTACLCFNTRLVYV